MNMTKINYMKYSINKVVKYEYSSNFSEHAQNSRWDLNMGEKEILYLPLFLNFKRGSE